MGGVIAASDLSLAKEASTRGQWKFAYRFALGISIYQRGDEKSKGPVML